MNLDCKTILRITGVSVLALGLFTACGEKTAPAETPKAAEPAAAAAPASAAGSADAAVPSAEATAGATPDAAADAAKPAEAPEVKSTRYEDWVVNCPQVEGAQCEAVQTLAMSDRPIARIAVGRSPVNDELAVAVNLPSAVAFGTPVTLAGEGGADPQLVLNWRRCGPVGCFADGTPPPAVFAAWSAHVGAGRMAFQDFNDTPVSIAYSFKGLDAAIKALSEEPVTK